jgi:O-methyltransferase involved in polyketide biosynthesis
VFDTTVPHSARVWNYWLGGKDNFPVDRAAGDKMLEIDPEIVDVARASRAFLVRAVQYLTGEAGIRQFLDVGTGLPTADNTHEIAQRVDPRCRIVYVDNDPLVLVHARALLVGTPEGATEYIEADVRDAEKIIAAAEILDLTQPVALMMLGILGHVTDDGEAYSIVNRLMGALPSGSYLVINDGTNVIHREARDEVQQKYVETGGIPYHFRSPEEITRFFDGLELLEPGVVSAPLWRPAPGTTHTELDEFCGVARKP